MIKKYLLLFISIFFLSCTIKIHDLTYDRFIDKSLQQFDNYIWKINNLSTATEIVVKGIDYNFSEPGNIVEFHPEILKINNGKIVSYSNQDLDSGINYFRKYEYVKDNICRVEDNDNILSYTKKWNTIIAKNENNNIVISYKIKINKNIKIVREEENINTKVYSIYNNIFVYNKNDQIIKYYEISRMHEKYPDMEDICFISVINRNAVGDIVNITKYNTKKNSSFTNQLNEFEVIKDKIIKFEKWEYKDSKLSQIFEYYDGLNQPFHVITFSNYDLYNNWQETSDVYSNKISMKWIRKISYKN